MSRKKQLTFEFKYVTINLHDMCEYFKRRIYMLHVTKDNFNAEVVESKITVVLDFWASWCGPCKMLAPVFEEISKEMPNVKFGKVDVDEEMELARQFGVSSIPMLAIIKDGKLIGTLVGYRPKAALAEAIKQYID